MVRVTEELGPQARRVLDAALVCLARVGLAKTTLDDVAREAGCARATVYRCFPSKLALLTALVEREAGVLQDAVLAAAEPAHDLADAVTATITTAAGALRHHRALGFIAAYEPAQLLPYLTFDRESTVLAHAAVLVAPAYERFLAHDDAVRLGEWVARITLSYLCSPSEQVDIADPVSVRALVDDFVLPGFIRSVSATPEGISQ